MTQDALNNEYFEWMYQLVCDKNNRKLSYRKLMMFLHTKEFTYILERDENRAIDGVGFRYRFGYECGYDRGTIEKYLDTRPCSVLEMMMVLAFDIEEDIMDDAACGNRTGLWFWEMIVSLGLGSMSDSKFDRGYAEDVIFRFLNRKYSRNGQGGLFTVQNRDKDMRTSEIWHQAMCYINEYLET